MRKLQKLVRNGNSTQFTLPQQMLVHLGWLAGEYVIVELLEDGSISIRYPREQDFVKPSARKVAALEASEAAR